MYQWPVDWLFDCLIDGSIGWLICLLILHRIPAISVAIPTTSDRKSDASHRLSQQLTGIPAHVIDHLVEMEVENIDDVKLLLAHPDDLRDIPVLHRRKLEQLVAGSGAVNNGDQEVVRNGEKPTEKHRVVETDDGKTGEGSGKEHRTPTSPQKSRKHTANLPARTEKTRNGTAAASKGGSGEIASDSDGGGKQSKSPVKTRKTDSKNPASSQRAKPLEEKNGIEMADRSKVRG